MPCCLCNQSVSVMKREDKREVSLRTILPVVFPTYTLYDLLFIVMFDMGVVEGRCFDQ